MSRMTKYLKQKCTYEKAKRDENGNILHDKFGDPQYGAPEIIKCRREETIQDVQTSTGAILKSSTRYFTDDKQSIKADTNRRACGFGLYATYIFYKKIPQHIWSSTYGIFGSFAYV